LNLARSASLSACQGLGRSRRVCKVSIPFSNTFLNLVIRLPPTGIIRPLQKWENQDFSHLSHFWNLSKLALKVGIRFGFIAREFPRGGNVSKPCRLGMIAPLGPLELKALDDTQHNTRSPVNLYHAAAHALVATDSLRSCGVIAKTTCDSKGALRHHSLNSPKSSKPPPSVR
jgi:hypothetical protein